jgi:hypothetical protein
VRLTADVLFKFTVSLRVDRIDGWRVPYLVRIIECIRLGVAILFHVFDLLFGPRVQSQTLHFRNMRANFPVNSSAIYTDKYS